MTTPRVIRSAPVLQVRDVVVSEAFYGGKLGFRSNGFWGEPPCFCIVGRDAVTLFLDQAREPGDLPVNQYWAAYMYVDDVDALHAELRAKGVEILRGPEDTGYGCRELDVRDPDGHVIGFGQDLEPPPKGQGL